jgi:hypothetical protein
MSGELPPLYGVSGVDHGAYCIISTATWACVTGFTVVIRFGLAWHHKLKVGWDDISFALASVSAWCNIQPTESMLRPNKVFAIASLVLYPVAVYAGLGRHMADLDAQSASRYFKVRKRL